jgi:sec-independent protein translocase protein TatA
MMFGFLPNIGATELVIILVIALLIFGPSKLPELGKSVGRGIKEFRNATGEVKAQALGGLSGDEKQ